MEKFYITTAIPYVNADPHIGFALELVQGDVLARYHRLTGGDVRFLNGTDENALKNVQAAEKAGIPVKEFVDQHAQKFIELSKKLDISNDDFIRTTEERHKKAAQKLWIACDKAGDIYKKKYKGLYCVGCEEFKTKKELIDGGLCPEHKTKPEEVEEENYFFKLSKYQKQLLELIEANTIKIVPTTRKNEVVEFIRDGLEDFSISRSVGRAKGWGIPVPGDENQIIYVWFDALVNYISALGYAESSEPFETYWNSNESRCHLIGKGITRFHAIYWPAMLISAGIKTPSTIYVHGYVTANGEKISKSLGNVIDPFAVIEKYGSEAVRYFLLREIPSGDDGDFSYAKLEARYNGDLANGLGNLVQRVLTLVENNLEGKSAFEEDLLEDSVKEKINSIFALQQKDIASFNLHEALAHIWELISFADKYTNEKKPWALAKTDRGEFLKVITNLTFIIYVVAWSIRPFLPQTSEKIFSSLGVTDLVTPLKGFTFSIKKGEGLFPRL